MADEEARRKQHKREKRARQTKQRRETMGLEWAPDNEYQTAAQRAEAHKVEKTKKLQESSKGVLMPPEYQMQNLMNSDYKLYTALYTSGKALQISKSMKPEVVAAIWFSDIDQTHSFNTKFLTPAANYTMATLGRFKNDKVVKPQLLVPFAIACIERRFFPTVFEDRRKFIKLWHQSQDDLPIYSQKQAKEVNQLACELRKVVLSKEGVKATDAKFKNMAVELRGALEEDEEEAHEEQGQKLAKVEAEDIAMMKSGYDQIGDYTIPEPPAYNLNALSTDKARTEVYRQWANETIKYMSDVLRELQKQPGAGGELYTEFSTKIKKLLDQKYLRTLAAEYGFKEFALDPDAEEEYAGMDIDTNF